MYKNTHIYTPWEIDPMVYIERRNFYETKIPQEKRDKNKKMRRILKRGKTKR